MKHINVPPLQQQSDEAPSRQETSYIINAKNLSKKIIKSIAKVDDKHEKIFKINNADHYIAEQKLRK